MKKLISLLLAAMMVLSLAACSNTTSTTSASASADASADAMAGDTAEDSDAEEPTEVTVTGVDANGEAIEVTVPYKPQRVVVLDLANLDILDNLGLGDCVVGVPTITLDYLSSYAEEKEIVGTVKTPDLEAVMACEPDLILMGGRGSDYYEALCEIAPVVRLTTTSDDGLVEAIRANATTVGTIFGEEDQVNALLEQYDARIATLAEFAAGKTCVLGMCTTGSFNLLGNDGRCSLIVNEVGFENIGVEAATTTTDDSSDGSTPTHGNEVSFEAIVALNPDYIFVMDRDAAIGTSGAQLAQEIMENELIMKTDAYQNGNMIILENPGIWYLAEGGITSLGIMLDDLESALLS